VSGLAGMAVTTTRVASAGAETSEIVRMEKLQASAMTVDTNST
jgi:hypothetical protein